MKLKFIKKILLNNLMKNGIKNTSEKLLLKIVKSLQKRLLKKNFENIIQLSIINSSPHVYIKSVKRRKREPLKVPFLFNNSKKISYAAKFIVKECLLDRSRNTFQDKVSLELFKSANFEGKSTKKTEELLKSSFINKKFSNYRWFN